MLNSIQSPGDIKQLDYEQMAALAREIRLCIENTVMRTGGHLASNLGVVELTLALHKVCDLPREKIIFDVGHQSYTHKLLTGRQEIFKALRSEGGASGFQSRAESEYDAFGAGHASTAISAAVGIARAQKALGQEAIVVAVVGDGALTGGEAYEALNDLGHSDLPVVVIINDNGMSISSNVGGLTRHLNRLRTARWYWRLKDGLTDFFEKIPHAGERMYKLLQNIKNGIKGLFLKGQFFEALGLSYIGPVDGHDLRELVYTLERAKKRGKPVVVHVSTQKGRGSPEAEDEPERFHGLSPERGEEDMQICGTAVAQELCVMAQGDRRVCAVTAAMPGGTGLSEFGVRFPERMYDVGIAEEHAATMAAGLAAGGMRPYFAVYSTFAQRCFDQMLHDAALQKLCVTFLLDRAGYVGEDGATHQGIYDIAMLLTMPTMRIWAPRNIASLRAMLRASLQAQGPIGIRYPRVLPQKDDMAPWSANGAWATLREGAGTCILAVGAMVDAAMEASRQKGLEDVQVVAVETLWPLDEACLAALAGRRVLTAEEGSLIGGFGALVSQWFAQRGLQGSVRHIGAPRDPIAHATVQSQRHQAGLDAQGIARSLRAWEGPSCG